MWNTVNSTGLPNISLTKEMATRSWLEAGPTGCLSPAWLGAPDTKDMLRVLGLMKIRVVLTNMCNLLLNSYRAERVRLFLKMHSEREDGKRHKQHQGEVSFGMTTFIESVAKYWSTSEVVAQDVVVPLLSNTLSMQLEKATPSNFEFGSNFKLALPPAEGFAQWPLEIP